MAAIRLQAATAAVMLALTACAGKTAPQQTAMAPTPPAAVAPTTPAALPVVPAQPFETWLQEFRAEALGKGIGERTVVAALTGIQPIPRVIELDRKQPETTLSWEQYFQRIVSDERAARGRQRLQANKAMLREIGSQYGVDPRFVVALWGIETNYGAITGGFQTVPALATLAWEGRRANYFRGELLNALQIVDQGHVLPERMVGSWAGALGQVQFMPSSFLRFAQDWNGDGRRDIWTTEADAWASAANYLARSGWKADEGWGFAVSLPDGFDASLIGPEAGTRGWAQWQKLGVKAAAPPSAGVPANLALIGANGGQGPFFLVGDNFRTIMKWNRSTYFALAVGHLADRIGSP